MEHGPPSPGLAPHEEVALVARHASPRALELGPSPRNTYPLVVIAIRGGAGEQVTTLYLHQVDTASNKHLS